LSSDSDDPPTKPKKKGGKALKALKAGLEGASAAKPVSRNPGLAAGAVAKALKKKAR